MSARLVPIAEIARPHGVGGELRVKLYNEESPLVARGRSVTIETRSGERSVRRIGAVRKTTDALLVRLDGVDDRDAAEALRGARVLVDRAAFPEPEEGEFYAVDVEGARAELDGRVVGTVQRLVSYPACDVLLVKLEDGRTLEVPNTDAFVEEIDAAAGVVRFLTFEDL